MTKQDEIKSQLLNLSFIDVTSDRNKEKGKLKMQHKKTRYRDKEFTVYFDYVNIKILGGIPVVSYDLCTERDFKIEMIHNILKEARKLNDGNKSFNQIIKSII